MSKKLLDLAQHIGFTLTDTQAQQLAQYAQLVWQKKDFLNLTSAADLAEVYARHLCDGLQGARCLMEDPLLRARDSFSVIDAGAGAGYIGLTLAIALPQTQVTLVESIEKRCAFMNWAILQIGLKNVHVKSMRLGEQKNLYVDVVTERAMGQLKDIIGLCAGVLQPGGIFMAYQGEQSHAPQAGAEKYGLRLEKEIPYRLPADEKVRHLAWFVKQNV